jgi:hypothetical protein
MSHKRVALCNNFEHNRLPPDHAYGMYVMHNYSHNCACLVALLPILTCMVKMGLSHPVGHRQRCLWAQPNFMSQCMCML